MVDFSHALNRLPGQLRNPAFRFVRIDIGSKKPFEPGWNVPGSKTNYSLDDPKFQAWIGSNQNYGVVAGIGGLIVFDADGLLRLTELGLMAELPETFTVRTGGGGLHLYYLSDLDQKIIMYDRVLKDEGKPLHLGEVQSRGFQAVGPGSLHPNGKYYKIERDISITPIDSGFLKSVISKYVDFGYDEAKTERKRLRVVMVDPNLKDPFDGSKVDEILSISDGKRTNGRIKGSNPFHGSKTRNNFEIDLRENTWRCWRCFPSGTLVNTPAGLRDIKDIRPDDEVLSREGKPQKVITTFRRCYGGQLYKISSSVAPVEVTRGHQILVMRCHECPKTYESYKACAPNCPRKNGNCAQNKPPEEAWVKVENINPETDFLILPKSNLVNDSFFGKDVTPEMGRLFGWYLAEGHVSNRQKGKYPCIQFTLGYKETEAANEISDDLLSQFGYKTTPHKYDTRGTILVSSSASKLANVFKQEFGTGVLNKHMGRFLHAESHVLENIVSAYEDGDGCLTNQQSMQVDGAAKTLLTEYQIALAQLGFSSKYYYSDWDATHSKDGYHRHPKHMVISYKNRSRNGNGWFDENHWYVPINKIETSEFVGQVYNLNTEDNTYQVPFVVHNCGSGGGPALAIAVKEGILRCDQARKGVLRGDLFRECVDVARRKGYIGARLASSRVERVA